MKCLEATSHDVLTLRVGKGVNSIECSIDSAFAVHPNCKSHVGVTMGFKDRLGKPISTSAKQKLNTTSSTTAEPVGMDHVMQMVLWAPLFLEQQGCIMDEKGK